MADLSKDPFFIGRPDPKAYSFDEKEPPAPQNPALRGLVLHYLAQL